jgi:hypothetical protein
MKKKKQKRDLWGGKPDSFQGICRARIWKILEQARREHWSRNRIALALYRARIELGAVEKKRSMVLGLRDSLHYPDEAKGPSARAHGASGLRAAKSFRAATMIAALYIDPRGPYPKLADVECWDEARDARKYDGPYAVVAHPPCGAWGSLRHLHQRKDAGCAPRAIEQVREFGGVLEHPARSKLWEHCALPEPECSDEYGFSIEVEQVSWGHVARKRTWLYIVGVDRELVERTRKRGGSPTHWCSGFRTSKGRAPKRYNQNGSAVPPGIKVCSAQQRRRTPPQFAEWLVMLARQVKAVNLRARPVSR